MGKARVEACHAVCTTIVPDPPILNTRTFYCKLLPKDDQLTVYFDVSSASDLPEEVYPLYTSQRENAVIVISNAPNDKFFLSFGKGVDDGVFSESIGHRLRAPAVRDDVFPRLKAMFRFRKLLGTPKPVNGEKWGTRKEPESTIEVSFHSVGRKNGQVKVEEGITIPWPRK